VYHVFAVRHRSRDALASALEREGIGTGIHYPLPVHLQPAYRDLGHGPGDFPVSEQAAREVLSLPLYPEMTTAQVEQVSQVVRAFDE
jgi:dTDP-4-amino-4,6-dideoxygalactose transaminase